MMRKRWIAAAAASGLLALGISSPAFAGTPGGSQTGNISIAQTLELTLNTPSSFTLTTADTTAGSAQGGGTIQVTSSDPSGYYVDTTGPASFVNGSASQYTIPVGDVSFDEAPVAGGEPLSSSPQMFASNSGVTGGSRNNGGPAGTDNWAFAGYWLNTIPLSVADGNYAGVIQWTLFGN